MEAKTLYFDTLSEALQMVKTLHYEATSGPRFVIEYLDKGVYTLTYYEWRN